MVQLVFRRFGQAMSLEGATGRQTVSCQTVFERFSLEKRLLLDIRMPYAHGSMCWNHWRAICYWLRNNGENRVVLPKRGILVRVRMPRFQCVSLWIPWY